MYAARLLNISLKTHSLKRIVRTTQVQQKLEALGQCIPPSPAMPSYQCHDPNPGPWSGSPPKFNHLSTGPLPTFGSFCAKLLTVRQKQPNRQTNNDHYISSLAGVIKKVILFSNTLHSVMRRRPDIAFLFSYGELRDAFRANREFELACAKQSILSGVRTNHFRLSSSGVEPPPRV